jgi:glycosyltransferase involved in cell wall biosynthesis
VHVFFIPSWYPTRDRPVTGCFLREQALALGRFGEGTRVSVSLHGAGTYFLDPRSPGVAFRRLLRFFRAPARSVETVAPNVVEIDRPVVEWSARLAGGNTRGMLSSHYANFVEAEKIHGKVDLIHAHVGFPAGWIAWQLARRFRRPFVITEHWSIFMAASATIRAFPFPSRAFLKADGSLAQRLIAPFLASARNVAVSPALAHAMASVGVTSVTVIPNLVDEERFLAGPPARSTDDFVFFSLCSLEAGKGIDDLLKAAERAMAELPRMRLVIGGDGSMRGALEALAGRLGISERVNWLGRVDPAVTPGLYQNCDAFILASRAETFGVVYVEALACGKPVIATRCGGPESIVHEGNGLLVPIGDVPAIASAMLKMARNPDRYRAEEVRCDFMEHFSRPAVVRQLLALYRSVLADPQPTRGEHDKSVA